MVDGGMELGVVVAVVGVDVGSVGWGPGVVGGGSLKITFGFGVVVTGPFPVAGPAVVVAGPGCAVAAAPVGASVRGGTVVVLPGDVVADEVDVAPGIVEGGVVVAVVGTKMLVGPEPGWARAASPVGAGLPPCRVVASPTRLTTMIATTRAITAFDRFSGVIRSHHRRIRSPTRGRPNAALFPMDPYDASPRRRRPGGAGRSRRWA